MNVLIWIGQIALAAVFFVRRGIQDVRLWANGQTLESLPRRGRSQMTRAAGSVDWRA